MRKPITADEVLVIHDRLIKKYGGSSGVINKGLVEFPVDWINKKSKPLFWKVATLMRGIVSGHPFVDGNKRTGLVVADIILNSAGHQFIDEEGVRDFVLELAANEKEVKEVIDWLRTATKKVDEGGPARRVQKVSPPLTEKAVERLLKDEIRPKYERLMLMTT